MSSKAFYAFKMKIDKFDDDIDLVDVIRDAVVGGDLSSADSSRILDRVDPIRHTHIRRRRNSDGGRKLVANHLRNTVHSSYVKDLYEEVTHYLREVLRLAALNGFDAGRLVGEHSYKIDARTVLLLGDWASLCEEVSTSVFQALEAERSTLRLLEKMRNKLGLEVDSALIEAALPYLEARHLLVHNDGKASAEYREKFNFVPLRGQKIRLDMTFIENARRTVTEMLQAFDAEIVSRGLVTNTQLYSQPGANAEPLAPAAV